MSISTALTGDRWAGDVVLRLVGQMGLMNHWTRVVVVSSLNVIGSRWTRPTRTHQSTAISLYRSPLIK